MKPGLKDIVGHRIAAVVVAENPGRDPRRQVFLVFSDGSCFEFHGREFTCNAGLDPAGRIERYVESAGGRITRVYGDAMATSAAAPAASAASSPQARPQPQRPGARSAESTEASMARDLAAWRLAKAAIAKASKG